jgi:ABC-type nitrate/sulfonate/bicarbonate transport system permease component
MLSSERRLRGVLGIFMILALWEILASTLPNARLVLPSPVNVAEQMWRDKTLYAQNVPTTLEEAGFGWLWGNLAAIVVAATSMLVPLLERPLVKLAIVSYCMPIIAIGPILMIILSGRSPEIAMAAISVFFTTLVGCMAGLRSVDRTSLDVVHACGGGSWKKFMKVRVRSALPNAFAGLQIAGPAALLGAMIGEYLGAEQGVGVAMVNSQVAMEVATTWGLALVAAAIAGAAYAITALIGNLLTPWRPPAVYSRGDVVRQRPASSASFQVLRRVLRMLAYLCTSIGVVVGLWYGLFAVFKLSPYFAKTPLDVIRYLFVGPSARSNLFQLLSALATTLRDAGIGYVCGTLAAIVASVAVVLSAGIERTVMPVAIALRAIPIIAMTPLIGLEFGRGLVSVTMVAGMITFFPSLVNFVQGLRSTPQLWFDLINSYGAKPRTVVWKVRVPHALPSFFAAAKIAAPGAVLGAVLAEWLISGNGLGYMILISSQTSDYNQLWSGVVLTTAVSVLIYNLVSSIEATLARRYSL